MVDEGKEESVSLLNVMESASGLKSLRLSSGLGASYSFSKTLAMPDRYPFDVSDESFGIRAKKVGRAEKEEETERILKLRLERFMKGKRGAASGSSINKPVQNQVSSSNIEISKAGGTAVITNTGASILSVGSTGTYYVYSFDGKLLAEYNGLGEGMRDYIYLGDRLLAEYQPQTGQIYYYTSDQVNSTTVVTDQNGVRVFAATYDPYGGIQKIWENSYMPAMKFSGKERDSESNLDYFGARYYGNYYYRWLSPDPVINRDAALTNPQLWNLYAFCHNNPVTYWDPDGMDVFYATEQLRLFFGVLAARSQKVRDTLALYEGEGRPNLHIEQGDAGIDIDGEKAYGSFAADIIPDYGENLTKLTPGMTLEEMENLATWSVREATLVLDTSLTISIFDRDTVKYALHELGHADQAARSPLQYRRDLRNIRDKKGIIEHDRRPGEKYAISYEDRARKEVLR